MNRVIFLIDGFNLYHSVVEASRDLRGVSTKWLDIRSFCKSYLPALGKDATEEQIYYFSALAEHLIHSDSDTVNRHKSYIECLKSTGIIVELGRFKAKEIHCPICKSKILRHEEKETDVAISTKLFEVCFYNLCDTVVLVTGDTDIAPAVRTVQRLCPEKKICFLFPYLRKNKELAALAYQHFRVKKERYSQYQFTDPFALSDGRLIRKPAKW